mgnify:CR=1 FL=1|jgi:NADPH-dependent 7-cyano-7-deazaguanine reductase QueF-like protein
MSKWKFWEKKILNSELGDIELKVLSTYLINQQNIINSLSGKNQQLVAEVSVLREVLDDLSNINSMDVNKALKLKDIKRKTSPFIKN